MCNISTKVIVYERRGRNYSLEKGHNDNFEKKNRNNAHKRKGRNVSR